MAAAITLDDSDARFDATALHGADAGSLDADGLGEVVVDLTRLRARFDAATPFAAEAAQFQADRQLALSRLDALLEPAA